MTDNAMWTVAKWRGMSGWPEIYDTDIPFGLVEAVEIRDNLREEAEEAGRRDTYDLVRVEIVRDEEVENYR